MPEIIKDGTGKGYLAEVDSNNRLRGFVISRCDCTDISSRTAESYEFATGSFITLANDTNEHAIFYIKNTSSTMHMHIHEIRTCGTAIAKWTMYKNDTGGDLISDGNAGVEVNHNFTSSNVAEADVWTASASGKTRSGGSWMSQHIDDIGHSELKFEGALILSKNNSLTLTATLASAAASKQVCCRIHVYYEDI